jgi:flagellar biosynthesis repressor protein FlbT
VALRLLIKPGEKIHFGTSSITVVAEQVVTVIVEGAIPVIRNNDYMEVHQATTAARRAYLALQEIYLQDNVTVGSDDYFANVKSLLAYLPAAADLVTQINGHLVSNEFYKALKIGRGIVQLDEDLRTWSEVTKNG